MARSALDCFRGRRPDRRALFISGYATLAASMSLLAATGSALADDPPLVLSNQHLDMTSADVESAQPRAAQELELAPTARSSRLSSACARGIPPKSGSTKKRASLPRPIATAERDPNRPCATRQTQPDSC